VVGTWSKSDYLLQSYGQKRFHRFRSLCALDLTLIFQGQKGTITFWSLFQVNRDYFEWRIYRWTDPQTDRCVMPNNSTDPPVVTGGRYKCKGLRIEDNTCINQMMMERSQCSAGEANWIWKLSNIVIVSTEMVRIYFPTHGNSENFIFEIEWEPRLCI